MKRSIALGAVAAVLAAWSASATAANSVSLTVERVDDFANPADAFLADILVDIPDVAGVTGVSVTVGDGTVLALDEDVPGSWDGEEGFGDLASLVGQFDGTWTIDIAGASASSTTFSFNAASLTDGDFFATPTNLSPPDGSIGVSPDVTFSWDDPTGGTAGALFVGVSDQSDTHNQQDNSITGTLSATDTSWMPPDPLPAGLIEFDVSYLDARNDLVGDLMVESGAIIWADSPFDPSPGGNANPTLGVGSRTIIGVTVVPEPATLALLGLGAGGVGCLQRKRRR